MFQWALLLLKQQKILEKIEGFDEDLANEIVTRAKKLYEGARRGVSKNC